jgi:hypothetical protein
MSVRRSKSVLVGTTLGAFIIALADGQSLLQNKADAQARTVQAPMFEVDPLWPKPLPNHWLLGWTIGLWVDEKDNVWVIHRGAGGLHNNERGAELNPPIAECCKTAPPILVYDSQGNLLRSWGARGRVTSGPNRITVCTSTTKATYGSAATARKMLTFSSSRMTASS